MSPAATVRPAEPADVDAIVEVTWAVAEEGRWIATEVPFDRAERRAKLIEGLRDPSRTGLFVAESDGVLVGEIGVFLAPFGVASIGMMVLDGHRGQGVGSALLAQGIDWARGRGAHKLALEVWPDNTRAIHLYQRAGFEQEGRLRRHYRRRDGELWDALVMGLLLR